MRLRWVLLAVAVAVAYAGCGCGGSASEGRDASASEEASSKPQEFPKLSSLEGVVMRLERTMCYGTCPAYAVEVHGDGTTIYEGQAFVLLEGRHRDHLAKEQVQALVEAFRKADFFRLKDEYRYNATDLPTFRVSFEIGALKKTVIDYFGVKVGMPQSVEELEMTLDRVAGTAKWVRGDAETVPSLKRDGWDFHSDEAQKTVERARKSGKPDVVRDLLLAGVPDSAKKQ